MNRAILALVGAVLVLGVVACPSAPPCTPEDAVMAAHALECAARVRTECVNIPDDECPAVRECDAWGYARCGFPLPPEADGGAAGAP